MEEDDDMEKTPRAKLSTPALVPWLPPGKPKDSTFNAYAHKKNEVQFYVLASFSPKKRRHSFL